MIHLNHIILRAFEQRDVAFLVVARNHLEIEAASQSTAPLPRGSEEFEVRLRLGAGGVSSGGQDDIEFAIAAAADETLGAVGIAGLYGVDWFNRIAEFGVTIAAPTVRGRGLGFDAHLALLTYAFDTLGLDRTYARVKADNDAARRTCVRLGMTHEGTLRQHRRKRGHPVDLEVFGLLRDEWDPSLIEWRAGAER